MTEKRKQRKHREWTKEEYDKILELRIKQKKSWKEIAVIMKDTPDNVQAAFRRATGTKHSAYKDVALSLFAPEVVSSVRVAVMDIETLPIIHYAWSLFDHYTSIEQVIKDSCMLSWAGKYLNEPKIEHDILAPEEAISRNTERLAKSTWDFLSKVDVVIGHNFDGFDSKFINTEFLKWGLPPLKYVIIDTWKVANQNFRFSSNKMKFINAQLGIREKLDNEGFPLWKRCDEGDPEALKMMMEYNIGDIGATEELYYKIRPYVRNFNVALYNTTESSLCPVCGSPRHESAGFYYTPAGKWESVRCSDCGCVSRKKVNLLTTAKKKSLRINS